MMSEKLILLQTRIATARQLCRSVEAERILGAALEDCRKLVDETKREETPGTEYRG